MIMTVLGCKISANHCHSLLSLFVNLYNTSEKNIACQMIEISDELVSKAGSGS